MRTTHLLACALVAWLAAGTAAAQNQVKPYFLVVFDTSGSMGNAVYASDPEANSCNYGGTNPSKMDEAKCALQNLVNATGDADFGLMQFAQTWNAGTCTGGTCSPDSGSALLRVPIRTNTAAAITALIDNTGTAGAAELCSAGYTPLGGTLAAAKDYFEGNLNYTGNANPDAAPTESDSALACRPLSVILLTDGVECCSTCANSAPYNVGCPKADPDLIAAGLGACRTTCGTFGGCGGDDGFESAPEKAYELRTETTVPSASGPAAKPVQTYVIGFGIPEGDERIERIAVGGGTDNPADGSGGNRAFYAQNEDELALAFTQIIADAQPPAEICNNLDDDCDTLIDEGIPKFCDKPNGQHDATLCEEPEETLCDNEDDDCDGLIDEGVLNACGVCGEPPAEVCDGLDNDCDSRVDEMTDGGECGTDEGRCEKGELRCIGGVEQCRGEVGPRDETCNCEDDDCDGEIDEDPTGELCGDGKCVACECIPRCDAAEEFMPVCDDGRRPEVQPSGECFCVVETCDSTMCAESTIERGDEVQCAPDDPSLARCLCRLGVCTSRCDGVTCADGQTCNARTGRCVEDSCRGLGCPDGGLCDPLELECIADPCQGVSCGESELCRNGVCERSCAGVSCEPGQSCRSGACVEHPCAGVRCNNAQLCHPERGECIANPCLDEPCAAGLVCSASSGECERDPCFAVRCPSDQVCMDGECLRTQGGGGAIDRGGAEQLLATGGGGCACRVTPGATSRPARAGGGGFGWALGLLAVGLLLRARRRRSSAALLGALCAVLAILTSACSVDPFCIDCIDAGARAGAGGSSGNGGSGAAGQNGDSGMPGPDAGTDAGDAGDAGDGGPPRCTDPEPEVCDGMDQDCDFRVDEEVESDTNDCVQFGVCAGTRPICLNGAFTCRYPDEREDDETLCDGEDNDCDNRVDEGHPTLGTACPIGVGACQVQGEWVCADNGTDLRCDGAAGDAGDEVCDGRDNDCDGMVDEPKSEPGTNPSFVQDDVVQIGSGLWIYRYEASRPDATEDAPGTIASRACSRAGVRPWTNLLYEEAVQACAAADMGLCSVEDWVDVCDGPANSCLWSYTPDGGSCPSAAGGYPPNASPTAQNACNGHDLTAQPGDPDVDDLAPTGAYPRCFVAHGGEPVYDLSGNAKEWTVGTGSPAENPLRGGSYNNLPGGMRCDFDFAVASDSVRLRNVGFRCCSDANPNAD